jgi:glycosyltransferase involved in cell wall biosynthesis
MRIICISSAKIPSDTANSIQVMKVCQAFVQNGNEVLLFVPGSKKSGGDQKTLSEHYGLTTSFQIKWLPVKNRRIFPWAAVKEARQLKPDILYTWPFQAAALGLLTGLPTLLEIHDYPSGRIGPLWLRLFLLIPGRKRLLPITGALQSALRLPSRLTRVAPDGVDIERYASLPASKTARRRLNLPDSLTVLCTGHLYQGRGAEVFLHLARKFPKTSFIWVGGQPADVQAWSRRADRITNAKFIGFVPNALIPFYQAAADVLLMPYQRTVATSSGGNTAEICSPMKMFEYMAAGRAILTSDLPVLREVLDETTAVFCLPDDLTAWEAQLKRLLHDPSLRKKLGESARRAVEKYSWKKRAADVLEGFYETGS